jgi:hypothetical protein
MRRTGTTSRNRYYAYSDKEVREITALLDVDGVEYRVFYSRAGFLCNGVVFSYRIELDIH